jgi:hypothetical protein
MALIAFCPGEGMQKTAGGRGGCDGERIDVSHSSCRFRWRDGAMVTCLLMETVSLDVKRERGFRQRLSLPAPPVHSES